MLAGTTILVLLAGLAGTVVAQDGTTASSEGVAEEPLFEITIPPELMPTELGHVNLERHELSPGSEISIDVEIEAIRGQSFYVAEGVLVVTPMVDAWVWRSSETRGGTPVVAVAGEPTELATGDVIYLPAVPEDRLPPDATTVPANPGETTAPLLGHHVHDASITDMFGAWPDGMSGTTVAIGSNRDVLAMVMAGGTTFRLAEAMFEPGASMTPEQRAAMVLAEVESGMVDALTVGPGVRAVKSYPPGAGSPPRRSTG